MQHNTLIWGRERSKYLYLDTFFEGGGRTLKRNAVLTGEEKEKNPEVAGGTLSTKRQVGPLMGKKPTTFFRSYRGQEVEEEGVKQKDGSLCPKKPYRIKSQKPGSTGNIVNSISIGEN